MFVFMPICYICVCICVCVCVFPLATAWFKLIAKEICPVGDQNCETGPMSMGLGESRAAGKTGLEMERLPQHPVVYHHFPHQKGEESRHLCSLSIYLFIYLSIYLSIYIVYIYMHIYIYI